MSAIVLTDAQTDRAYAVASDIGRAVQAARMRLGYSRHEIATACDSHIATLANIEYGASPNLKLGNALKFLNYLGLTLAVVPTHESTGDAS